MSEDVQYLKLLAIFHYIVGGITALFSSFFLIHVAIGIAILSGAMSDIPNPPPKAFGWLFVAMPGALVLAGWTIAVAIIAAGQKLAKHNSRTYCLVVAGIECVIIPFGTVLGVFTIIVLLKDSVRRLFEQNASNAGFSSPS